MLHRMIPAGLENVVEPDDVRLDIDVRMVDGIPDPRLRRQIDDHRRFVLREDFVDQRPVRDGTLHEDMLHGRRLRRFTDQPEAVFLELRIVVVVHVVQGNHRSGGHFPEQPQDEIRPDESGRPGDENGFAVQLHMLFHILHLVIPL